MKKEHLEEKTTEAKGLYMYSILRTCLYPSLEDWECIKMRKELEILKKVLGKGNTLQEFMMRLN